jgi:hypothetical protein
MAWRPTEYLVQGELDNTTLGKVTGWMEFAGKGKVTFDLKGGFHRDIRGAKIHFKGSASGDEPGAEGYMEGFSSHQTGNVGDITAGLPPADYVSYPYIEWYGDQNGRIVLELEADQIEVIGKPIPACESDPISRGEQNRNMAKFLGGLAQELNVPKENAICVGGSRPISAKKPSSSISSSNLLTKELRNKLPPLDSQDGLGGRAIAYVKFFTPDSNWTWWATEGSPIKDDDGNEIDFHFFGLVEGFERELGYFSLSELESAKGPMGLPIERDLHWQPKMLEEIAPEMFKDTGNGGD